MNSNLKKLPGTGYCQTTNAANGARAKVLAPGHDINAQVLFSPGQGAEVVEDEMALLRLADDGCPHHLD